MCLLFIHIHPAIFVKQSLGSTIFTIQPWLAQVAKGLQPAAVQQVTHFGVSKPTSSANSKAMSALQTNAVRPRGPRPAEFVCLLVDTKWTGSGWKVTLIMINDKWWINDGFDEDMNQIYPNMINKTWYSIEPLMNQSSTSNWEPMLVVWFGWHPYLPNMSIA